MNTHEDKSRGTGSAEEDSRDQEWHEATGPTHESESLMPEQITELDQYKGYAVAYSVDSGKTWLVGSIQQINFTEATCLMLNASKSDEMPTPYIIRQEDLTKKVFRIRAATHEELRGVRLPDEHAYMLGTSSPVRLHMNHLPRNARGGS